MTAPAATAGGGTPPGARVTDETSLAQAGWPIQVVQRNDPASRIMGLRNRVILYGQSISGQLEFSASNNVNARGRLEISVKPVTEDLRRDLTTRFGPDKICIRAVSGASPIS